MMDYKEYDVVIIGAGPAGLSAGLYTSRLGLSTIILDKMIGGGQLLKTDLIENFVGGYSTNAEELADKMIDDATKFGAELVPFATVSSVLQTINGWMVTYDEAGDIKTVKGKAVLVATGTSHKELPILTETIKGISYCAVCDAPFYKQQSVAVVGAGDTALESVLLLAKESKHVYILVRSKVRAKQYLIDKASKTNNITFIYDEITKLTTEEDKLTGLELKTGGSLAVDGLFVNIGASPETDFLKDNQLTKAIKQNGYLIAYHNDFNINEDGLFVAGDVTNPKHRQVAIAVGEGAKVALEIHEYLENKE